MSQPIGDLRSRVEQIDAAIGSLKNTRVWSCDVCILDTLRAQKKQLWTLQEKRDYYHGQLNGVVTRQQ